MYEIQSEYVIQTSIFEPQLRIKIGAVPTAMDNFLPIF